MSSSSLSPITPTNSLPRLYGLDDESDQKMDEKEAPLFKEGFSLRGSDLIMSQVRARMMVDRQMMLIAIKALSCLHDHPKETITKCLNTFRMTEPLFTKPEQLLAKLNEFIEGQLKKPTLDEQLLQDFGISSSGEGREGGIKKSSKNLADYYYHTINHAREMFSDTFVTLTMKEYPEHLCLEGAFIAFEHDLIQGLGAFPSTGQNENATAKFLNYLMEQANSKVSQKVLDASQKLSDASIVGGTTLVMVYFLRNDGEKVEQFKAIAQIVDHTFLVNMSPSKEKLLISFLIDLREILAVNDTDRTRESFGIVDTPKDCSEMTKLIFEDRKKAIVASQEAIKSSLCCQKLIHVEVSPNQHVRMNEISRLFQSIRMMSEIGYKIGKAPKRTYALHFINNGTLSNETDETKKIQMEKFINEFAVPNAWLAEVAFARPSGHEEYVQFLSSESFKNLMLNINPTEKMDLLSVAIQKGQVGEYLSDPSHLLSD